MKKHLKRFLGLAFVLVLSIGVLAGCGNSSDATTSDSDTETYDDQLAAIQEAGKIVVGVEGTYPPFTYHDDSTDELTGFDVELAKAIGEKLGVEVEFVEAAWDSLLAGIDSGRVDTVINAVSTSDERREKYDFSDVYLHLYSEIWVTGDNDEIKSVEDLDGKKIATNTTNVFAEWYKEQGAEIVSIDTSGEAMELLLSGRVDFLGSNSIIINNYISEHPDTDVKSVFTIPDSDEAVAIPFKKGETRLVEAVNSALDELRADGTLSDLSVKYFGKDYTEASDDE